MNAAISQRVSHRSKIIEGQIAGLHAMIEKDAYCMDIVTQSLAIQKSLASLNKLVIENHIATHIKDDFTSGDSMRQDSAIAELARIYELDTVRGK